MSIEKGHGEVGSRLDEMGRIEWQCWNATDKRRITKAQVELSFKQGLSVDNCP